MKTKPIAVLISDVHYSLHTLELADAAMRQAIAKANELKVKLIVAGDLHDTKANLRGECVNRMIETFKLATNECVIIIGNHDLINEKAKNNSLEFLDSLNDMVWLVRNQDRPVYTGCECIAYHSDVNELKRKLKNIYPNSIVIMHQGITGSNSGEYIQDRTAITPDDVAGLRVISGHYHARQTIKLPNGGQWDYIGNPYTLNFAEANDPEKGYQILYEDGNLEFVPTNLRKHVVLNISTTDNGLFLKGSKEAYKQNDIVWVKAEGTKENLLKASKETISAMLGINSFKFDKIERSEKNDTKRRKCKTTAEQLDELINELDATDSRKETLKNLWKAL